MRRTLHERDVQRNSRRLGRHVLHDPASKDFPADTASQIISVTHQARGLPLDQGDVGSCTANALCGALNSDPDYQSEKRVYTEQDALWLYTIETQLEGQPYPQNDPGGTGLEVCKAGRQLGWVHYYRHAFGLDHALRALVKRPVIFGINWYGGFDQPDSKTGVVRLSGGVRGGHEIVADEIDTARELVGFWNSWGSGWGLGGRFYMPYSALERLLGEDGDATVPYPVTGMPDTGTD